MTKGEWVVRHGAGFRERLVPIFQILRAIGEASTHPIRITWRLLDTRTLEQNARLNASIRDVAQAISWDGEFLSVDEWRAVFVASFRRHQKVVRGIDGGVVVLGASSRDLTVSECSEVMELVYAFGAENGVTFREP